MSDDLSFSVAIPDGTQVAAGLLGMSGRLSTEMRKAMTDIETQLIEDAQGAMDFKNPSGDLSDSLVTDSQIPDDWHLLVGSSLPYAHRREYSFKGPDSLGRMFPNDPANPYLEPALDENTGYIEDRISLAVSTAMHPLGN